MTTLRMSTLPKTWVLDVDGTIVVHNGHLRPVGDELLPGVKEFFASLPPQDVVVLLTAQKKGDRSEVGSLLHRPPHQIRHHPLRNAAGERILVNDCKPSGLPTAFAINKKRDEPLSIHVVRDETL